MDIANRKFVDEHVNLTGCNVDGCEFSGCVVEIWKGRATRLSNTTFQDCQARGDGWPKELIDKAIRADGGWFKFSSP